jgi:phosphoribosyl-ATP pyrophosphohydrolase/phosphoribosyl-AMP cyclohydrolase
MTDPRVPSPAGPVGDPRSARFDAAGLVPVVVQDVVDGRVLMVAWTDAEALTATLQTGEVHFHSRSRGTLWRKGETSGNTLRLVDLQLDCDGDALLAQVEPAGPTCHRGERSCFDPDGTAARRPDPSAPTPGTGEGFAWLETLWATIAERAASRPEGSYTARLLDGGVDAPARKVVEEATEVLVAAKDDATSAASGVDRTATRDALAGEVADLVYHVLVVLAERGLPPSAVIERLRARHGG